jgi:2-polyprenyl-3-methyl-5-hydroxy-6-metoxy-1,4-benzoquinol methylase
VSLTGTDILTRPTDLVKQIDWIATDLNQQVPLADASFDTIVSTEVIEHLENPRAVFREFNRLLKPHGYLVVTTPNQESIRSYVSLCFGGHFAAFRGENYPAHITALLRKDLQRISLEAGFNLPLFSYTDYGRIPKVSNLSWQRISCGFFRGRLFSDNFAIITQKRLAVAQ